MKNYGADILRAWVTASDYAEDLRIDNTILSQHAESYRKIRNTFRFILGNLRDKFEPQILEDIDIKKLSELDRYILNRLFFVDQSIKKNLKNYNLHKIYKDLSNFCTLDLSSFYFDIRKDSLYCDHEKNFTKIPSLWKDETLDNKWKNLFKIKQEANIAIEAKRAKKEIGSSLEAEIEIFVNETEYKLMENLDLAEYFITSKASIVKNKIKEEKIKVIVKKTKGDKCPRCWKILQGKCNRCDEAMKNINVQ